jgi:2-oxoglutarate dehydrogenase E2 component (dihydrolipoamide succinyltransferase)
MTAIKVPPLGESIVEATISRWLKNEGDAVSPGETLVELETDKITVDVPVMASGVLKKRLKAEGDVVKVDEILAEIEEGAVASGSGSGSAPAKAAAPAPAPAAAPAAASGEARVSPAAAKEAAARGVDAAAIKGTGRGGVVSKADVVEGGPAKPAPASPPAAPAASSKPTPTPAAPIPPMSGERETREKMTTRRKKIAEHLLESQHATAHLTTFNEIDMTAVNALRERLKERIE